MVGEPFTNMYIHVHTNISIEMRTGLRQFHADSYLYFATVLFEESKTHFIDERNQVQVFEGLS